MEQRIDLSSSEMFTQQRRDLISVIHDLMKDENFTLCEALPCKLPNDGAQFLLGVEGDTVIASEEMSRVVEEKVSEFPISIVDDGIKEGE